MTMDGFGAPVHLNRDAGVTGMSREEFACKNVTVRARLCTRDVELLLVSLHPSFAQLPKSGALLAKGPVEIVQVLQHLLHCTEKIWWVTVLDQCVLN